MARGSGSLRLVICRMAGYQGEFRKFHKLPPKIKIPKGRIAKVLSANEAKELLGRDMYIDEGAFLESWLCVGQP